VTPQDTTYGRRSYEQVAFRNLPTTSFLVEGAATKLATTRERRLGKRSKFIFFPPAKNFFFSELAPPEERPRTIPYTWRKSRRRFFYTPLSAEGEKQSPAKKANGIA